MIRGADGHDEIWRCCLKKVINILAVLGFLIPGVFPLAAGQEEPTKKIAIASDGKTLDSHVETRGARSRHFLLFDEKGELTEILENPHRNASGGAGPRCAELLAEKKVTVLVAGNVGYKMADALKMRKIAYVEFAGTVKEAIEHVLAQQ
jgi:predicted Fe-Mo cluster-binding NifX family protein